MPPPTPTGACWRGGRRSGEGGTQVGRHGAGDQQQKLSSLGSAVECVDWLAPESREGTQRSPTLIRCEVRILSRDALKQYQSKSCWDCFTKGRETVPLLFWLLKLYVFWKKIMDRGTSSRWPLVIWYTKMRNSEWLLNVGFVASSDATACEDICAERGKDNPV